MLKYITGKMEKLSLKSRYYLKSIFRHKIVYPKIPT